VRNELVAIDPKFVEVPTPGGFIGVEDIKQVRKKLTLFQIEPHKFGPVMVSLSVGKEFAPLQNRYIYHVTVDSRTELSRLLEPTDAVFVDVPNPVVRYVSREVTAQ
jgi:hypothetical protein